MKSELVLKLTEKEIERARQTFHCFDKDMSGTISFEEATRAHRNWFSKLYQNKLSSSQMELKNH